MGVREIVELHAGDRQHRLAVEFGIVQPIQKVNAARTGGRQTATRLPGVFGIGAGHKRGGLFMANLDESDRVLPFPQGLHDAVDAVARQPEHTSTPQARSVSIKTSEAVRIGVTIG